MEDHGVPARIRACLFDLDGGLTQTARVHAAAWKAMFDTFLQQHAKATGTAFVPFDDVTDYERYVDGRPRLDGTRTFLASRGIDLPEGDPHDPAGSPTVYGLGNAKNEDVLRRFHAGEADAFPGAQRYVEAVRAEGRRTAVVSSSANALAVLESTHIRSLFDAVIDGDVAAQRHLAGKPAPDTYLAAAAALDTPPEAAAVYEDATVGVQAARAGKFGWVVGVGAGGHADDLRACGADAVVADLSELLQQ
jgi:HAD superfamily hydrolase (TIGR01509 family)